MNLADCTSSIAANCELYIVQGESVADSIRKIRNHRCQAVLPIRGDLINADSASMNDVLQNEEVRTIITAVGTGIGISKEEGAFQLERFRYGKIILLTTSDSKGLVLRARLLILFFHLMPELIKLGYIFIIESPVPHEESFESIMSPERRGITKVEMSDVLKAIGFIKDTTG